MYLIVTDEWKAAFPGASFGLLALNELANPESHPELEQQKAALEAELRTRFAGQDRAAIEALPVMQAYRAYYRNFKKTYHVQLQLESVALKGKSLPRTAALVEAMFMAEIEHCLLTAGHDLDTVQLPLTLDVATGAEQYRLLRGQDQTLKPGDMFVRDRVGVISSIIYGPDERTPITAHTHRAVFTIYAPPGIHPDQVRAHLKQIQANASLIAPGAQTETLEVYEAGSKQ